MKVLLALLSQEGLAFREEDGYLQGEFPPLTVTVEMRPVYCDRGRYVVKAWSGDPTALTVDMADGFPRYYFHPDCAAREIHEWLKARGRTGPADGGSLGS